MFKKIKNSPFFHVSLSIIVILGFLVSLKIADKFKPGTSKKVVNSVDSVSDTIDNYIYNISKNMYLKRVKNICDKNSIEYVYNEEENKIYINEYLNCSCKLLSKHNFKKCINDCIECSRIAFDIQKEYNSNLYITIVTSVYDNNELCLCTATDGNLTHFLPLYKIY